jgi:hypothetical protein
MRCSASHCHANIGAYPDRSAHAAVAVLHLVGSTVLNFPPLIPFGVIPVSSDHRVRLARPTHSKTAKDKTMQLKFSHVDIVVHDLDKAVDYYRRICSPGRSASCSFSRSPGT